MSSEDDTQADLRALGWAPRASALPLGSDDGSARRRRRGVVVLVGLLTLAVASATLTVTFLRDPQSSAAPQPAQLPTGPILPPMQPAGSVSSAPVASVLEATAVVSSSAASTPTPAPTTSERPAAGHATPSRTPTRAPGKPAPTTKAPAPGLVAGATIGLALSDHPGVRVRHRDFLGRVDSVGAGSSSGARADSRFVVRSGLTGNGCFSFESVNYPGYFLRHRNFVIHLDRRDGSGLFSADATFCRVAQGSAFSLRSVNYPSLSISAWGSRLQLARSPASFVVRPPL